jgi:hypothetical protein
VASITETPPAAIREELTRLRRQLGRDIPKKTDRNLLIATWNLREFGDLTRKWDSTQADTPKRDLHALACIKEIVKRFDVVAIQEAQKGLGLTPAFPLPSWLRIPRSRRSRALRDSSNSKAAMGAFPGTLKGPVLVRGAGPTAISIRPSRSPCSCRRLR